MGKYTKKRKGFTLVELLMVIIIIGVLASSMLLIVGNAEDKAEATVIVSDMRSLKAAVTIFRLKEGHWPELSGTDEDELRKMFGGASLEGFSIGKPETDTMSESYFIIYDLGLMKKSDGVRGKLALMAASAGLLNEDGEQYNNENEVLMKLD